MNLVEIKKLVEIFNNSSQITKLSIKQDNFELKLDKNAPSIDSQSQKPPTQTLPPTSPAQVESNTPHISQASEPMAESNNASGDFITSPMVGTFYHRPSPEAPPYVNVGDVVKKGQTIGIIEAMKIMNEIEAEFDCKILAVETGDGQPVEFGSNLIRVEKI